MAKSKYQSAKQKSWAAFSKYIRLRDAVMTTGTTTHARCITCGKVYPIKEMDAGHWIPRNRLSTFMDERNVHAQCRGDNRFGGGRTVEYQLALIALYGSDILERLTRQAQTSTKIRESDWRDMEKEYKERARVIEENEVVPQEWADVFLDYVAAAVR